MNTVYVVGAAILRQTSAGSIECLVAQRSARMSSPLAWEFPGGKVEPGESPTQALRRELAEELGVRVHVGEHLARSEAPQATRHIVLDVYAVALADGQQPRALEHAAIAWRSAPGLDELTWAKADVPVVEAVQAAMASR